MAGPPARCLNSHCGHIFEFANFIGGAGSISNLRITGSATNCPLCGSEAALGDGTYQFEGGSLLLKDGPPLTRAMIDELVAITEAAKAKRISAEELLAEVASVSPELATKLRDRGLGYFVIVLFLLWLIKSVSINVTVDVNELIDQARGVASENSNPSVLDTPLPAPTEWPNTRPPPTPATKQAAPMSRQVRRQLERQTRKANRRGGRIA